MPPHARRLTIQLALTWCVTGLALNALATLRRAQEGLPVLDAGFYWTLFRWGSWALLAAPIVLLAIRFRPRPGERLYASIAHFGGAVAASLAHSAIFAATRIAFGAPAAAVLRAAEARVWYDLSHDALIYATSVAACWTDLYFRERRRMALREARLETRLRQSEARAMRDRLQPDDVSRSLASLAALLPHDRAAAEDALEEMAQSLRARIDAPAEAPASRVAIPPPRRRALAVVLAAVAAAVLAAAWRFAAAPPPALLDALAANLSLSVVAGMTIVAFGAAALESRATHRRRLRALALERRQAEAEARVLRTRLEPHFLFNSLNSVAALADSDAALARVMLVKLQELYEAANASPAGEIAVRDELALVERYLFVESIRFRDRLAVSVDCPDVLQAAAIPSLLLQPLVENAVRHGIAGRTARGRVSIRLEQERQRLRLTVSNDLADDCDPAAVPREGGGLSLTRARLGAHYGDDFTFTAACERGRFRVAASWPLRSPEAACAS